ncbi:MAG: hypothetical protein LBK47_05170 [Prevotellaceae bacterium]|jgi:hypothetical protein|nr:hypothetical protein [Prevotellaceae bacterium]
MNMHDSAQQTVPMPLSLEDVKKKIAPIFDVRIPQREATFPVYAKQKCGDKDYSYCWYFVFLNRQDCLWITSDTLRFKKNRDDFYRSFLKEKNIAKETKEITYDEFFKYAAAPFFKRVQRHAADTSEVWLNEYFGDFYFKNDKNEGKNPDCLLSISEEQIEFSANSDKFLEKLKTQQGIFEIRRVDSEALLQRSAEKLQEHIARFVRLVSPPVTFDKKVQQPHRVPARGVKI